MTSLRPSFPTYRRGVDKMTSKVFSTHSFNDLCNQSLSKMHPRIWGMSLTLVPPAMKMHEHYHNTEELAICGQRPPEISSGNNPPMHNV